jgi:hypothetical protein
MTTSDGLDDRHQIIEALNLLAFLLDHREWDRLDEVMTADVEAYDEVGLDAVVANKLRALLGGCGPSQHLLGNYQVAPDGDRATSVCRIRVYHQGAGARSDLFFEVFGEYHDTWVRTAAGWRMAGRRMATTIVRGDIETLQPG